MHILGWLFRFRGKVLAMIAILSGQELEPDAGVHIRQLCIAAMTSLIHSKIQFG